MCDGNKSVLAYERNKNANTRTFDKVVARVSTAALS